jgi:acetolactate synthase-1/2/3 large subunit
LKEDIPQLEFGKVDCNDWCDKLYSWKMKYSVYNEPHTRDKDHVNSFDLMQELGQCLHQNDILVTDMGTSFTCTMQSLRSNGSNRLFTSSALCSMGFGLPGSIGAQIGKRSHRTICIVGDGGIQMNIQELQTIAHHNLPIKIILLNNDGMLAISLMQDNLFNKNRFGADSDSGVSNPNFIALANAYGIPAYHLSDMTQVKEKLHHLLDIDGPVLIEVNMVRNQLLIPRVQSKRDPSGKIVSGSLETMFPFIEDEV